MAPTRHEKQQCRAWFYKRGMKPDQKFIDWFAGASKRLGIPFAELWAMRAKLEEMRRNESSRPIHS